jgi:FAD synthase
LRFFIREEQKFPSFEALKDQIVADAAQARGLLDGVLP